MKMSAPVKVGQASRLPALAKLTRFFPMLTLARSLGRRDAYPTL